MLQLHSYLTKILTHAHTPTSNSYVHPIHSVLSTFPNVILNEEKERGNRATQTKLG